MRRNHLFFDPSATVADIAAVGTLLGKRFLPLQEAAEGVWELFDTPDWALWQAGMDLQRSTVVADSQCQLRDCRVGLLLGTLPTNLPDFVWQLPPSPLRQRLTPVWGVRAMLAQVQFGEGGRQWALRNDAGKLLATAHYRYFYLLDGKMLGGWLQIEPCRGYHRSVEPVLQRLGKHKRWQSQQGVLSAQLLAAAGVTPAPPQMVSFRLQRRMSAAGAVQAMMAHQITIMRQQQVGMVDAIDSEFLHRYRIAVRRIRSLLKLAQPLMPPELYDPATAFFRMLGGLTTPARDSDVCLLNFVTGRGWIPAAALPHLTLLRARLESERNQAYQALRQVLLTSDYLRGLQRLERWDVSDDCTALGTQHAVLFITNAVQKQYRRLVRKGKRIHTQSPDNDLHALRKEGKRLRYTLDCFAGLFPASEVQGALRQLKQLQERLGDFQDLCVQEERLRAQQASLDISEQEVGALLLQVADGMTEQRQQLREEFSSSFHRFLKPKKGHTLAKLCAGKRGGKE
ncbi:MAG: CHAD domain-containing protein [Mariprofundales bacterium]|nr:CHAD domain-containing protein [Mariprofundales bacterium]